jgi:hypothetical protein
VFAKAVTASKLFYPYVFLVTSLAHGLDRVAKEIQGKFTEDINFIRSIKRYL